jgi:predicted RNase H-like nuclease (RuvC/YqgF family)
VKDAIEEVNRIIATLKDTLEDMEEVLETIEVAERQKTADEHEIESLRRALGRLHRPRDRGHHSP